jgi:pimeloyl-ACP methyl ester carboxylesterase
MRLQRTVIALLTALGLAGCAQKYATLSHRQPQYRHVSSTAGALTPAEDRIVNGLRLEKRDPLSGMGEFLAGVKAAADRLASNPKDERAREAYNFGVSRVFGLIQKAKLDPWSQPLRVPVAGSEFILTRKPDARPEWNPTLYEFSPADEFDIGGSYVKEQVRKEGVGAPLVAIGRTTKSEAERDFRLPKVYYGVTALIRFEGSRALVAFEDPLITENVSLGGHTQPLAADFTVPLAVLLAQAKPEKLELTRLLRPEKYAETARIARLQPYDPNRTVVLVIHGLMDSPATWAPMINHLRSDESIRRKYQFWFYSYPSGYPYPYSASILRSELGEIEQRYALKKKMVVIGHSMGGCISRLLITDSGNQIWMRTFGKPPEQVAMDPETKKLFTDALIFKHRPEIGRVIFISSPLRGADLASNWAGRIGSSLVKSPATLLKAGGEMLKFATFQGDELKLKRMPNSIDTLAPNNRFVREINRIPLTPGIPHHVISGDRGKGGNKDQTAPVMNDGIVPYWSSHMETAQSELVVPSHHSAHQNPQAMAEVARILKRHAR